MQGAAPGAKLTGVPGWETPDEQEALFKYAQEVPSGGVIVEIGGEFGMSASIFAVATQGAVELPTIISIDERFDQQVGEMNRANLALAGLAGRVQYVAMDSHDTATPDRVNALIGGSVKNFDLLFVDGDHSEHGAYQDLTTYARRVKVGGKLLVHDCACQTNTVPHIIHFDVMRAVLRWFNENGVEWRIVDTVNTLMIFERTVNEARLPTPATVDKIKAAKAKSVKRLE